MGDAPQLLTVGVIGTGAMGSRFAQRLLDTGHEVTVYNRTPAKAEGLRAAGAHVGLTPRVVAENCDVPICMVWDSPALQAVALGPDGF
ncbi:MAG: NAD(P)-dependent oxidoreductase, partial [Pseudonocardiales bacterium]|nr:NAD(P)-dependent oxidoreductase [Pseudonocardiales bacterium]